MIYLKKDGNTIKADPSQVEIFKAKGWEVTEAPADEKRQDEAADVANVSSQLVEMKHKDTGQVIFAEEYQVKLMEVAGYEKTEEQSHILPDLKEVQKAADKPEVTGTVVMARDGETTVASPEQVLALEAANWVVVETPEKAEETAAQPAKAETKEDLVNKYLDEIDHTNDALWTGEGKVNLMEMNSVLGFKLTRADVEAIRPHFVRTGA